MKENKHEVVGINNISERSQKYSSLWKALSTEQKQKYDSMAQKEKEVFVPSAQTQVVNNKEKGTKRKYSVSGYSVFRKNFFDTNKTGSLAERTIKLAEEWGDMNEDEKNKYKKLASEINSEKEKGDKGIEEDTIDETITSKNMKKAKKQKTNSSNFSSTEFTNGAHSSKEFVEESDVEEDIAEAVNDIDDMRKAFNLAF